MSEAINSHWIEAINAINASESENGVYGCQGWNKLQIIVGGSIMLTVEPHSMREPGYEHMPETLWIVYTQSGEDMYPWKDEGNDTHEHIANIERERRLIGCFDKQADVKRLVNDMIEEHGGWSI